MSEPTLVDGDNHQYADPDGAVVFLRSFLGKAPWPLVAIRREPRYLHGIEAATFDEARAIAAAAWIREKSAKGLDLYFAINPLRVALTENKPKAKKVDVAAAAWLWIDIDPAAGADLTAEQDAMDKLLAQAGKMLPPPSWIIDSGRGRWAFWRLRNPVPLDGAHGRQTIMVEAHGRGIEQAFGNRFADNCRNVDRIARLPGTINTKTRQPARVMEQHPERAYEIENFPRVEDAQREDAKSGSLADASGDVDALDLSALEDDVATRLRTIIKQGSAPGIGHESRSETVLYACCELIRADVPDRSIIALLLNRNNGISQHIYDQAQPERYAERQLARALEKQPRLGPIVSDDHHVVRALTLRGARRPNLVNFRDDFMDFEAGAYRIISESKICADAWNFLNHARTWRRSGNRAAPRIVPFCPDRRRVGETLAALKAITHLEPRLEMPCWLDGRDGPPPSELISFPNGLLDLRTNELLPSNPAFFTTAALGFDYQPEVSEPRAWLRFLDEIFAGERAQIEALQEVFGYLVTGDVSMEKAFLLLGPTRSGKGTMLGMLRKLLAPTAVVGPSLLSLSTNFGLAPLISKQVAIIDDLRVGSPKDQDVLIENVLKITGRGWFTLDRKFKEPWHGSLAVKLVLVSNVMPKLGDDSAAVANRFMVFNTRQSFYGREDPRLLNEKLLPERLGVLHWALAGLRRLHGRQHFIEPDSSKEARERLANLGSPIRAFINERCVIDTLAMVAKKKIYEAWCVYAAENALHPSTMEKFCESLYAASGGRVRPGKPRGPDGRQVPSCMGIRLLPMSGRMGAAENRPEELPI
jgi:P4 family phage/plasmid primase-like protien